jgi:hypothetical protein
MNALSDDVIGHIFNFLQIEDCVKYTILNKKFNEIIYSFITNFKINTNIYNQKNFDIDKMVSSLLNFKLITKIKIMNPYQTKLNDKRILLDDNHFKKIIEKFGKSLKIFIINSTKFNNIDFSNCNKLRIVELSKSFDLSKVIFSNCKNLKKLNLSYSNILDNDLNLILKTLFFTNHMKKIGKKKLK